MLEELRRRNFADTTICSYLHGVEHFSRYFRRRPDQLGPEDIRKYQAMLFTQLKFSPNTVILRLASLRFFYIHVLKRGWSIAETPYPKKVRHLPQVLSQDEVARLIDVPTPTASPSPTTDSSLLPMARLRSVGETPTTATRRGS